MCHMSIFLGYMTSGILKLSECDMSNLVAAIASQEWTQCDPFTAQRFRRRQVKYAQAAESLMGLSSPLNVQRGYPKIDGL